MDDRDHLLEHYMEHGYAELPVDHLPAYIQRLCRTQGVSLLLKGCFHNAQQLVMEDEEQQLTYCEGWVEAIIPMEHAWVELNGEAVEITMSTPPKILSTRRFTRQEVRSNILKTGMWTALSNLWELSPYYELSKELHHKTHEEPE